MAAPALPIINAPHVHDIIVHPPAQMAIRKWREEAEVTREGVGGEDVRVRITGHDEEITFTLKAQIKPRSQEVFT